MKISAQLRFEDMCISSGTVKNLWIKEPMETRCKQLLRMEEEKKDVVFYRYL